MTSLEKSHTHVTSSWFARQGGSSTFTPSVTCLNTQPKAGIVSRGDGMGTLMPASLLPV